MVLFLFSDLLRLEPLATPAFLSEALLGRQVEPSWDLLFALKIADLILFGHAMATFTILHLAVFASLGIGAAFLFESLEVPKNAVTGALYGLLVGSTVFYTGLGVGAGDLLAAPNWRLLLFANGVAGVIMVSHLKGKARPPRP